MLFRAQFLEPDKQKDKMCAYWAAVEGECEKNPQYMTFYCGPVCNSCELTHVETRCPLDPNATDALYPGDLNKMFERIVSDPHYNQFNPTVLSRPEYAPGDGPENATYQLGPWLMTFDNMVSPDEAKRIIELGAQSGFERSEDVGKEQPDGTYDSFRNAGRTSTNTVRSGFGL